MSKTPFQNRAGNHHAQLRRRANAFVHVLEVLCSTAIRNVEMDARAAAKRASAATGRIHTRILGDPCIMQGSLPCRSSSAWLLCCLRFFMVFMSRCRSWSSKLYFHAKSLISGSSKSLPQARKTGGVGDVIQVLSKNNQIDLI